MRKKCRFSAFFILLFTSLSFLMAQELTVTGVVHDNEGETLPGVSVVVKGSTHGTVTGIEGKFEIRVPQGTTLEFSYVGFQPLEIKITNQEHIDVVLTVSTVGLDEVIVVGYGTQSRRTVTSAITKVGGEALQNIPISTVGEGLKGKIAGARIYTNNNSPGADATIRIRGGSSIT